MTDNNIRQTAAIDPAPEETEKERYRASCISVYFYSPGGLIVLSAAEMFLVFGLITQITTGADALALMKTLFLMYLAGIFLLVSYNMRVIFGQLKKSDTPFIPDICGKMKKLAGTFMIGGALGNLFPLAGMLLDIPGSSVFAGAYVLNAIMLASGYVFNAFVFVFMRGAKLQQEYDETL